MRGGHKDMLRELETLKSRLKQLLYEGADERSRNRALLREHERKIEDRFAMLGSMETMWEEMGKKFRKGLPLARNTAKHAPAHFDHMTGQATIAFPSVAVTSEAPKARAGHRTMPLNSETKPKGKYERRPQRHA